uniref:Uncharacterized protein n=1 Tax=Strongyloides stercoralis TaxID=6248 RepID=A0A0K0DST4_STRER
MSRDRKSRRTRSKSRDLESRRRSRKRNHSVRGGRNSNDRKGDKSSRNVSRRSRKHRYKVRDGEQSLPDISSTNLQQPQFPKPGGEGQQLNGAPNVPQPYLPPTTYDSNQKIAAEAFSKSLDSSNKQIGGGSFSESHKATTKRVRRTAPNLSANYHSLTISSQKVDGKMVHSIITTTTENIPKRIHFDCNKNNIGNKNILDNFEILKVCKNIQNSIRFGNCPKETIPFSKYNNRTIPQSADGGIFKTKDDVKLNSREMLLARMHSLQNKFYLS